jgi:hypothetical protein
MVGYGWVGEVLGCSQDARISNVNDKAAGNDNDPTHQHDDPTTMVVVRDRKDQQGQ